MTFALITEVISLVDRKGAPIEDGGHFPGVLRNPSSHLVVQVSDVEQES